MAKKQQSTTRVRRADRKNITVGQAHIKSTFNNTIVFHHRHPRKRLPGSPQVRLGSMGSRKSTPFAAQMAAEKAAKMAMEHGLKKVSVFVKGPGSGRETAIRLAPGRRSGGREHPGLHAHPAQRLPSGQASSRLA